MDKAEFVQRAPIYYALAISVALLKTRAPVPEFKIRSRFPHIDVSSPEEDGTLLDRWVIWDRAMAWLMARDMVRVKKDPFGPPMLSQGPEFETQWNDLCQDEETPFSTFAAADQSDDWLVPALHSVENHFVNMGMTAEDFDNPDAEWTPIKIDLDDPATEKAIASLEQIIEEVRSDNGYSATYPHERDHILEGLQGTVEKFKAASISPGYVRIAIERLRMLSLRFSGTIKEVAITAAKGAMIEFAKKHFGEFLSYLWKWPF